MPIRETGVAYEFPENEAHRLQLVEENRAIGKMWLSTAMVEGRMRMKFGILEHYKEEPRHDFNSPEPYVPAPKPHYPKRPAIKKNTRKGLVGYSGRVTTEGRAEWDQ